MSILKSTKSGKSAIALTIDYLLEHHWCKRAPNDIAIIDDKKIWKNTKKFLYINYEGNHISSFSLRYSTNKSTYTMYVRTIADLEIVEQFWRKTNILNNQENAIKFLKEKVPDLVEESCAFWDSSVEDFTFKINEKILGYVDGNYKTKDSNKSWVPKKNYFASYFK
jgi:hypothetical protein